MCFLVGGGCGGEAGRSEDKRTKGPKDKSEVKGKKDRRKKGRKEKGPGRAAGRDTDTRNNTPWWVLFTPPSLHPLFILYFKGNIRFYSTACLALHGSFLLRAHKGRRGKRDRGFHPALLCPCPALPRLSIGCSSVPAGGGGRCAGEHPY